MSTPVYDPIYGEATYFDLEIDPDVYGEGTLEAGDVTTQVGADLTIDAVIRSVVGANLAIDAIVRMVVGKDQSVDALLESIVRSDLTIDAALRQLVGASLTIDAALDNSVGANLTIDAVIQRLVSVDLTIDAAVGEEIPPVASVGGSGVIMWPAREEERTRRRPLFTVGANLTIDAPIRNTVRTGQPLYSLVRSLVSADLALGYRIQKSVTADLHLKMVIVDWYDLNESILLAELDPDLADVYHARDHAA